MPSRDFQISIRYKHVSAYITDELIAMTVLETN